MKCRFPVYFVNIDGLSTASDGIFCLRDCAASPALLRESVFKDLHSGHFGVAEIKSLAILTYFWTVIHSHI